MRVAYFVHRIGPYHHARLDAVARQLDITAIEVDAGDAEYSWARLRKSGAYTRLSLTDSATGPRPGHADLCRRVRDVLGEVRPDAVAIPGWSERWVAAALRWCLQHTAPAIVLSASTAMDAKRSRPVEWFKRQLIRGYSAGFVGGQRQRDYLVSLGMPAERICTGYDAVDNAWFASAIGRADLEQRRAALGLPGRFVVSVTRFIPKKNHVCLLRGYAGYLARRTANPWHLVLVGDGETRAGIEATIAELGIEAFVHPVGFRQYDELPEYYALADAFVHASTVEQWGLVVNEAMAAGLPVIVSDRCGCVPDLVLPGNGFTFDPGKPDEITAHLVQLDEMGAERRAGMAAESRRIVSAWGLPRFAEELARAVQIARDGIVRSPGWLSRAAVFIAERRP